jgi:hypothetical protein
MPIKPANPGDGENQRPSDAMHKAGRGEDDGSSIARIDSLCQFAKHG